MEVSLMFPSKYLCAADFRGKHVGKTIQSVKGESLRMNDGSKQKKWLIYFSDTEKALVLNKTNAMSIAAQLGTNTDKWAGKKIEMYPTQCEAFGKTVPCIRIDGNGNGNGQHAAPAHDPVTGEVGGDNAPPMDDGPDPGSGG